jgi:hypothetical protein
MHGRAAAQGQTAISFSTDFTPAPTSRVRSFMVLFPSLDAALGVRLRFVERVTAGWAGRSERTVRHRTQQRSGR